MPSPVEMLPMTLFQMQHPRLNLAKFTLRTRPRSRRGAKMSDGVRAVGVSERTANQRDSAGSNRSKLGQLSKQRTGTGSLVILKNQRSSIRPIVRVYQAIIAKYWTSRGNKGTLSAT